MSDLADALATARAAAETARDLAIAEVRAHVARDYPTAHTLVVTAILDESCTEHDIAVLDADGNRLAGGEIFYDGADTPGEDWFMTVTETICTDRDVTHLPARA